MLHKDILDAYVYMQRKNNTESNIKKTFFKKTSFIFQDSEISIQMFDFIL